MSTFPNDETGQVLQEMQDAGIDLTQSHSVVFFQLFEKKEQAEQMVAHLAKELSDVAVELHPDEAPNVWDVDCTVKMIPTYDDVVEKEALFEKIAEKFNGYNDGWGIEA